MASLDGSYTLFDPLWFSINTARQYRPRGDGDQLVTVRKFNRRKFTRVPVRVMPLNPDCDNEQLAERLWLEAAYPEASPELLAQTMRRARRNGGAS